MLYLIVEFHCLKDDENDRLKLDWNPQHTLAKINYRIYTDAIKDALIPTYNLSQGGAPPPGAHAKGARKESPIQARLDSLGIHLSPGLVMQPASRPRYLTTPRSNNSSSSPTSKA